MKSRLSFLEKVIFIWFVFFRSLCAMEAPMPPSPMGQGMDAAQMVEEVLPVAESMSVEEGMPSSEIVEESVEMEETPEAALGADTEGYLEKEIGSQGNWVKKREWLKEAQKINDEIQDLVVVVQELRKSFFDKYSTIDNELDTFYKQEGFEQGKVQTLFDDLEKYLDKKRKKEMEVLKVRDQERGITGEYEIKLDMLEDEVKSQRTDLDQLKLDIKSISELDKSLDERLKKLDEQINVALEESAKARKLTNKIWYILDDKKARAIYYELKGNILEHVKGIQSYIQKDLTGNFDNVINVIRTQMGKVKSGIKSLENQGFIVKDRIQRVEELRLKKLEQLQSGKKEEQIEVEEEKEIQLSWTDKAYNFVVNVVARIYSWTRSFFGPQDEIKKTSVQKIEQKTVATMPPVSAPELPVQMPSVSGIMPPAMPQSSGMGMH